jgi:outer membrane protein assembly factor BamB
MTRILSLLLSTLVLTPAAVFADGMFRSDAAHTGVQDEAGPKNLKNVKWKFKTGSWVISSPVVSGSTVYVGSDDSHLYALDKRDGSVRWKFKSEAPVRSTPAVAGESVYFGSFDGVFYALDTRTGALRWKFQTEGEQKFSAPGLHGMTPKHQVIPDFWDLYLSSPVVDGSSVYFGSGDHHIYALDTSSGELRWKFKTGNVVHASPALADGTLYVGSWDTFFYALDAATGREKWRFKTGEDPNQHNQTGIQSSAALRDGAAFFGCRDGTLYAVDLATGRERWKFVTKPTWIVASPAVTADAVYFGSSDPAKFFSLDLKTGKPNYSLDAEVFVFSSPVVADGFAYFGSFGGTLYAVNLKTHRYASTYQTEARKKNQYHAINAEGKIDFGAIGVLTAFFEDFNRATDKFLSLGSFIASPTVDDGVLYIGSTDGNVYAFE